MAKIKEMMNLLVQKIQMKECNDWCASELDNIEPGLYLCETPDGGMFLMVKILGDARYGFWLPVSGIGEICAREAEQKVFEQIKPILEKGFEGIDGKLKKIESLAYDNNIHLNEQEEKEEEKGIILQRLSESVDINLANIRERIDALQRCEGNQKSTLAEMSDAVVNIIKATK